MGQSEKHKDFIAEVIGCVIVSALVECKDFEKGGKEQEIESYFGPDRS